MIGEIDRAVCHEAGHATVALHLGYPIERVSVSNGFPFCHISLDTIDRVQQEQFIVLTGGIAAEQYLYHWYDPTACKTDKEMIAARGGQSIDTYLSEAARIIEINDRAFRSLIRKLTCRMLEEMGVASFTAGGSLADPEPPSFELLSSHEIQSIWGEALEMNQ